MGGGLAGPQEAILSANEPLGGFARFGDDPSSGPPRPRIGDVLSVHLSQDARSAAVWTIIITVQVAQGWFELGRIVTNPPASGDPAARCIGFGSCPGAIGWKVICSAEETDEIAEIYLQSSQHGGSGAFGVTTNVFVPPG